MDSIFMKELQERFPDYTLSPIGTTSHVNVLRLSKDGHPTLVAKTIWHDASDPEGDMGIKAQDNAYMNEVEILTMLPSWWGIHLVDHFKTPQNRMIVTNEVQNVPWNSYKKGSNDAQIAELLFKQISWLHSHRIAHDDLELKNILLTDSATPIIIDFEKSNLKATKEQLQNDYNVLLRNMKEHANTESIGIILQDLLKGKSLEKNSGKYIQMSSHKYDITLQGVNKWACEEIKQVGKIVAVKDKGLQRAYARSTLNGMAYLRDAIYQLITDSKNPDYIKDELQILHDKVVRIMKHLIKDFDIDMKDIQEFNKNKVLSPLNYLNESSSSSSKERTRKNRKNGRKNTRKNNRKN
jgi:hypothetical protein